MINLVVVPENEINLNLFKLRKSAGQPRFFGAKFIF